MLDFQTARRRLQNLDYAANYNEPEVADLWLAIGGEPPLARGTFADAVSDTFPADLAGVLTDPMVADVALACHLAAHGQAFGHTVRPAYEYEGAQYLAGNRHDGVRLRQAARAGWETFREMLKHAEDIETNIGAGGGSTLPRIKKVAENPELMRSLKRMAALAGRMFQALKGARSRKTPGVPGEYHGMELSDSLQRMTGAQLGAMADDVTEMLAWEAYTRRGLQTFRVRGPAKQGRGPLVIAVDESGSMDGQRNEWAKAAMLALARSAHLDGRAVSVVHFDQRAEVAHLPVGDGGALIDAAMRFLSGNTDTARALRVANDTVKELAQRGHKGADIVMITDGTDNAERDAAKTATLDEMAAENTRLWTIAIDVQVREADPLRARASAYIPLTRAAMNDPNVLTSVVGAL